MNLLRGGALLRVAGGARAEEGPSLPHGMVEVAVLDVDGSSPLTGAPVHALPLPPGVILAAVATAERVFVPSGADHIPVGAKVVAFSLSEVSDRLMRLVERG